MKSVRIREWVDRPNRVPVYLTAGVSLDDGRFVPASSPTFQRKAVWCFALHRCRSANRSARHAMTSHCLGKCPLDASRSGRATLSRRERLAYALAAKSLRYANAHGDERVRLAVNAGIVLVFAAFYFRFLQQP